MFSGTENEKLYITLMAQAVDYISTAAFYPKKIKNSKRKRILTRKHNPHPFTPISIVLYALNSGKPAIKCIDLQIN